MEHQESKHDGAWGHTSKRGGLWGDAPWRRVLALWLTVCMVTSLVPATPVLAEELVGQGDSSAVAVDAQASSETNVNDEMPDQEDEEAAAASENPTSEEKQDNEVPAPLAAQEESSEPEEQLVASDGLAYGELAVSQRPAIILLNIEGDELGTATQLTEQVDAVDDIDAYVVDAEGNPLANQRVSIVCGNPDMASIASLADDSSTTVLTDQGGKASFKLTALLPGMTSLNISVEGSSLARTVDLVIEGVQVRPNRPTATITDGTNVTTIDADSPKSMTVQVAPGATLALAADEGDAIYYTTNDTCPCTDGSRTAYTGPITLQKSGYYRIAAYNGSFDPSKGGYSAYSRRLNITIEVTAASEPQVAEKGKTYKVGNYYYKVTNAATNGSGTVTLTKPAKTTYTSVTVPATVTILDASYKVTAIGAKAFLNNKKLKSAKTGANVTSIGASAFQGCVALTSLGMGAKLKTIGASAFQGCTALGKLAIGKAVATIGAKAFYGCKNLVKVSGGAAVATIGKLAFASCAKLKSFVIASKALKTIGAQAFNGNKLLKILNIAKTTKLKTVANALKGSKVATVDVANAKVKAYQKLFKKAGKSVKLK